MFEDLGVFDEDQHHTHVSQHKDVILLLEHLLKSGIFDFSKDKQSDHLVVDLFRTGLHRLAGPRGGHARHLQRHVLRSRSRHYNELPPGYLEKIHATSIAPEQEPEELNEMTVTLEELDRELEQDNVRPKLTLLEQLDEMMQEYFDSYDEYE